MDWVLITGAASGMGRVVAERHLAAGRTVVGLDLNAAGLEELVQAHPRLRPFEVDVSDTRAVEKVVTEAVTELGAPALVYTAAGIGHTGRISETAAERTLALMNVNYGGTVNTIAAVLPALLEAGSGRLVVFASLAGWVPAKSTGPYSATKAAVVRYAEVLRYELQGTGVELTCVCPPAVDTPLLADMPAAHEGLKYVPALKPEEVVDAIDQAVAKGRLWVFPGRGTALMSRFRRHFPRTLWRLLDRLLPNA